LGGRVKPAHGEERNAYFLAAITEIQRACVTTRNPVVRSPLEQEEREHTITAWLKKHGVKLSSAESLADAEITIGGLDQIAQSLEPRALDPADGPAVFEEGVHGVGQERSAREAAEHARELLPRGQPRRQVERPALGQADERGDIRAQDGDGGRLVDPLEVDAGCRVRRHRLLQLHPLDADLDRRHCRRVCCVCYVESIAAGRIVRRLKVRKLKVEG